MLTVVVSIKPDFIWTKLNLLLSYRSKIKNPNIIVFY